MSAKLALRDGADAGVTVPESLEDAVVVRACFEPEVRLERGD